MTADAHAPCAALTCDQWAWEFLRRNPDYQADHRAFIAIWRALEADSGAPPQRGFSRWKLNPRAYGPLPGGDSLTAPSGDLCVGHDGRVLLECRVGAKWGFYKFPLNLERTAPPGPDELSWRPPPQPGRRDLSAGHPLRSVAAAAATGSSQIPPCQPCDRTAAQRPCRKCISGD